MKAKNIELKALGSRRYEIIDSATGKFGLAVLNDLNQWEISPNMTDHTKLVLKRIHEIENPSEPKPKAESKPKSRKSK